MNIFLLADFSVIKPDPGLVFWTSIIFIVLWTVLGRMAFKPIQNALKKREDDIQDALDQFESTRPPAPSVVVDHAATPETSTTTVNAFPHMPKT